MPLFKVYFAVYYRILPNKYFELKKTRGAPMESEQYEKNGSKRNSLKRRWLRSLKVVFHRAKMNSNPRKRSLSSLESITVSWRKNKYFKLKKKKKTHGAPMGHSKLELLASNGVHICHAI